MPTKTGAFSDADPFDVLGPPEEWRGTGYTQRTSLSPDRDRPRRSFSAGSIDQLWDTSTPRVPGPAGGDPIPPIRDRGGLGFGAIDFGPLGPPQRAPKP